MDRVLKLHTSFIEMMDHSSSVSLDDIHNELVNLARLGLYSSLGRNGKQSGVKVLIEYIPI